MSEYDRHDTLFKETFSRPENARVELRVLLPPALVAIIDWETLVLEESEMRIEGRRRVHCDIFYGLKTTAGKSLKIYLLLEHQSAPDETMPQRLNGYMCAKYSEFMRDKLPLPWPVIIPAVVHHSKTGWKRSTNYHSLFDPEVLALPGVSDLVPKFDFLLDDVSGASDAELLSRATTVSEKIVPLTLWALRDGADEASVHARFPHWAEVFGELWAKEDARHILSATFRYLASLGLTFQDIEDASEGASDAAKEAIMTLAEQLEQRGEEKGRVEGRVEGRLAAMRKLLVMQLKLKFPTVDSASLSLLDTASEEELTDWTRRILQATQIEEIFSE